MDLSPEIKYHFSRSQGAGGQNVNKVNTKVNLSFNVRKSQILNEEEKERIIKNLGNRLTKAGVLRLSSQKGRTQMKNRLLVTQKFYDLIEDALREDPLRIPTKPTRGSKEKRLKNKKMQSQKKSERKKPEI